MSELDSIIFIYNIQASHWATIAILPKYKKIEVFDSIQEPNKKAVKALWRFFDYQSQLENPKYNPKIWKCYWGRALIPRQNDGYNCGFFAIFFSIAIAHRFAIQFISSDRINHLRTILILYFKNRPKEPQVLYDLTQHIPVTVLARSKGKKPSKKASGSGPSNLPSKKSSSSTSSPGVQATYNLTPNEGGGGDDEDPNKKQQDLERSHTVQTVVGKSPSKVTQEETSQDKDNVQEEETQGASKDTEPVEKEDQVEEEHKTEGGKADQEESQGASSDKEETQGASKDTETVEKEDQVEEEHKTDRRSQSG